MIPHAKLRSLRQNTFKTREASLLLVSRTASPHFESLLPNSDRPVCCSPSDIFPLGVVPQDLPFISLYLSLFSVITQMPRASTLERRASMRQSNGIARRRVQITRNASSQPNERMFVVCKEKNSAMQSDLVYKILTRLIQHSH